MQVLFIFVPTFVLVLVAAAVSVWLVIAGPEIVQGWRQRYHAWKNRRRHPDLARKYNDAEGEGKILVAQEMMMRDRQTERAKHDGMPGPNYPSLGDYHAPARASRVAAFIRDYIGMMLGHGLS